MVQPYRVHGSLDGSIQSRKKGSGHEQQISISDLQEAAD
jgi:hypothetical protein